MIAREETWESGNTKKLVVETSHLEKALVKIPKSVSEKVRRQYKHATDI